MTGNYIIAVAGKDKVSKGEVPSDITDNPWNEVYANKERPPYALLVESRPQGWQAARPLSQKRVIELPHRHTLVRGVHVPDAAALDGVKAQASDIGSGRTIAGTVNALVAAYLDPRSSWLCSSRSA